MRVSGCDDPQLWEAPALHEAELRPEIGGGPCSPAQYPLHQVAADTTAYVFAHADGNAALYQAPYVEFCE